MSLFGFGSLDELKLFETFDFRVRIRPETGMAMLSAMSADQVAMAIASGSVENPDHHPRYREKDGRPFDSGIER